MRLRRSAHGPSRASASTTRSPSARSSAPRGPGLRGRQRTRGARSLDGLPALGGWHARDGGRDPVRVHLVDPPAYTPPYDRALRGARGARREPTSRSSRAPFAYGDVPPARRLRACRSASTAGRGARRAGRAARRAAQLAEHVPDMLALPARGRARRRRRALPVADACSSSTRPCCRARAPRVLTAHDVLPREPRPGQRARAAAAATSARRRRRALRARARRGSRRARRSTPRRVHVIPHGAFTHLADVADPAPLPPELRGGRAARSSCSSACCGPTRASTCCSTPGARSTAPSCGSSALPRMDARAAARRRAAGGALRRALRRRRRARRRSSRRADLVVLPYREIDQSGVLFTALALRQAARAHATSAASPRSPRRRGRARPARRPGRAARARCAGLLGDPARARAPRRRGPGGRDRAPTAGTPSPDATCSSTARSSREGRRDRRVLGSGGRARVRPGRLPAGPRRAGRACGGRGDRARRPPRRTAAERRTSRSSSPRTREEDVIAAKVANARALDWPARPAEVVVACDGSPDATPRRAREAGRRPRARAAVGRQGPRPGRRRRRGATRQLLRLLRRQRAAGSPARCARSSRRSPTRTASATPAAA